MPDRLPRLPSSEVTHDGRSWSQDDIRPHTLHLAIETVLRARFSAVHDALAKKTQRLSTDALLILLAQVATSPLMEDILDQVDYLE